MKIRWMRWTMFVILLAALVGASSTRSQAAPARHWPVWSNVDTSGGEYAANQTLEYLLRAHGYTTTADGQWSKQTERALSAFQRRHKLDVDGRIVDGPVWEALIVPLKRGSRGDAVRAAQTLLEDNGWGNLSQDGVYGAKTEAAVRKFQRERGLVVDGVLGRYTWCKLVGGAIGNEKVPN